MFDEYIEHSGNDDYQTGYSIQETPLKDILLDKAKEGVQQHMKKAEFLPISEHVLGSGLRVLIDGLDLIGDISIGVMVILVLHGFDPPVHRYFGMEPTFPPPFVSIIEPNFIIRIPSTVFYPPPQVTGSSMDDVAISCANSGGTSSSASTNITQWLVVRSAAY